MATEIFRLFGSILLDTSETDKSLAKTEKSGKNLASTLASGAKTVVAAGAAIGAAATAAGAAIYGIAKDAAGTTDEIDKMSQKIGISREEYQELAFVCSQSGTDVNKLQGGMKTLTNSIDSAVNGGKTATAMFDKLGISVKNADGSVRSQEEVLNDAVRALQGMEDGAEKAALATDLFGKAGTELMPLLNSEAGSFDEMRQQAHDLGLVLSDEAVDAGVHLTDTIDQCERSFKSIVTQIGVAVMPLVQSAAEWVLENMPLIQSVLGAVFEFFGNVISSVVEYITTLKSAAADWLADHQGTIDAVLSGLSGLWQFVQTIFSALMTAAGALGDWLGAWADENLGDIVQTVTAAVNSIISFVSAFASWVSAFWQAHGQTIMSIVRPLLEAVKTIISTALQAITQIFNIFAALFRGDWGELFRGIATLVLTILNGIVSTIGNIFQSIINLIFAKYNDMYNAGRSIFQGLFDGIAGVWSSIYNWVVEKVNWLSDKLSFWNSSQSKMRANGSHATGLEYVPFDGYRAILHKGERVLTAEQAKEADKGKNGGNTRVVKVEIGQFINQTEKDIDELVEIIDEKLEERREREERV